MRRLAMLLVAFVASLGFTCAAMAQDQPPKFEVGPVANVVSQGTSLTFSSRDTEFLLGGRFTWNWLPHLSLEGQMSISPRNVLSTPLVGGHMSEGLFGVKSGYRWSHFGLFGKFRPGFVHYSNTILGINMPSPGISFVQRGTRTYAAYDVGGGAELYVTRHWLVRYDLGDTIVHRGDITVPVALPPPFFPFFLRGGTNNNFQFETAVAFRF